MEVKNTLKTKNVSESDNSEIDEDIEEEDNTTDEDIGDNNDENEEDDEEMSDNSHGEDDSDEDLGASDTESDEEATDDEQSTDNMPVITKSEKIKNGVLQKYQEMHGKKLYIRFPRSIAVEELEQKAKELSPFIVNVHKPRQQYARFCLVDFESKDHRDATLKELKKRIKNGELEKHQVDIPRTECAEYVQQLAERKLKSLENKKVKLRLKRASKKAETVNSFTSSVLVFNLPKTATVIQVRELFPSAVDVQIKTVKGGINKDKSIAAITLPSTMEARKAVKDKQLSLGGNQLTVKFDNQKIKKKVNKKLKAGKRNSSKAESATEKVNEQGPDSPIKDTMKNKKRKITSSDDVGSGKTLSKSKGSNKKPKKSN